MDLMRLHSSLVFTIKPTWTQFLVSYPSILLIPHILFHALSHSCPPDDTAIKVDDLHLADMSIRLLTDREKEKAGY
jgi:hypothetical protein